MACARVALPAAPRWASALAGTPLAPVGLVARALVALAVLVLVGSPRVRVGLVARVPVAPVPGPVPTAP